MQIAKSYCIARINVNNMDGYKKYTVQNSPVFAKYSAKFLMFNGRFASQEDSSRLM